MKLVKFLIEHNAQAKLQKLDYLIGAALVVVALAGGPWWLALIGLAEIALARLNLGKKIGERIAAAVMRRR